MSTFLAQLPVPPATAGTISLVLGDQLAQPRGGPADWLSAVDPDRDVVVMIEAAGESTYVPSHRQRIALFLAAMRHHALDLARHGLPLDYTPLAENDSAAATDFGTSLSATIRRLGATHVRVRRPGEWRMLRLIEHACRDAGVELVIDEDPAFLTTPADFARFREGRKSIVMDHFYRQERKRLGILLEDDGSPVGGAWSHDHANRESFKRAPTTPPPWLPEPDEITLEVIRLVARRFPDAPGRLERFVWATTPADARRMLDDFIDKRLPEFGRYQDAMWTNEPFLNHSLLSPAINLQLLDPRDCIAAAVAAFERGDAPIESVEGFVRQIMGWREFIRGVYWTEGADYADRNALDEHGSLPEWYWTGETDLACLRDAIGQVVEFGYGHHIQRLMITGNFALIAGIEPRQVSDWYLAMFVDAIDWVTLPNALGMVMHADGGVVGTKPYAASANYIGKMSNHCKGCRWNRKARSGDDACPFNVFYWDFLIRHRERLRGNRRMAIPLKNVDRLDPAEREAITATAADHRVRLGIGQG